MPDQNLEQALNHIYQARKILKQVDSVPTHLKDELDDLFFMLYECQIEETSDEDETWTYHDATGAG